MRQYESIFIVNPDLEEAETNRVVEEVKAAIESGGGQVLRVNPWGKRKLAYPIKRHSEGYYVLLLFESNPEHVLRLNTYYQISEPIIKHMVVGFEGDSSKLVESASSSQTHDKLKGGSDAVSRKTS